MPRIGRTDIGKMGIHFLPCICQDLDPPVLQEGSWRRGDKLLLWPIPSRLLSKHTIQALINFSFSNNYSYKKLSKKCTKRFYVSFAYFPPKLTSCVTIVHQNQESDTCTIHRTYSGFTSFICTHVRKCV